MIYKLKDGQARLDVQLAKQTVWLSLDQMADLFGRDKSVISRHIKNVFVERELTRNSVVARFATTAADGKIYQVEYYNLDMIISVGYRVKSLRGVQFRIWATGVLKEHLVAGYTINQKRLLEQKDKLAELQKVIQMIQTKSQNLLLDGQAQELLNIISDYSSSLSLLNQYDEGKVALIKSRKAKFILTYNGAVTIIDGVKNNLLAKKQASDFFGIQNSEQFKGIIGALYQSFGGKELYGSLEEKAANLLYLVIKDHPFVDGNKRLASILFIYFLERNNFLRKASGEKKINDNALTALALLTVISEAKEKETIIKVITNLLKE